MDARTLIVVDAFDLVQVHVGRLTIGVDRQVIVRIEKLRVIKDHRGHAGNGVQEGLEVIPAAQGEVANLPLLKRCRDVRAVCLQLRRNICDRDGFRGAAGLKCDLNTRCRVGEQGDILADILLKPGAVMVTV